MSSVLLDLRLAGTFFCNSEFSAPWAVEIPERDFASFHFVTTGTCWLQPLAYPAQPLDGGMRDTRLEPVELHSGDLILLARSPRHVFSSDRRRQGTRLSDLPTVPIDENAAALRMPGSAGGEEGGPWLVVCGGVRFESYVGVTLASLLPEVVVLRASEASPIVASALEAMRQESLSARPGGVTVMTRLADVVVIHAIRGWLERSDARSGWLAALRDEQIGRVMAEVHRRAHEPWSLEAMARLACLSRSRFAERFNELVGTSPKQYLTRVRMYRAYEQLKRERLGIAELAERFGYESEPAFARAFKRHMGVSPGRIRHAPAEPLLG